MPQQKKQYEDALGSVFDFIFEESQKPPEKRKPMKVTGVDGTSEMVEALTAVLENPGLYVSNTTMEAFKDAIDIDMVKATGVGRRVPDSIKFNLQDIGKIISDPGEYIDKQFNKIEGIRKQQRAAWAGEEMKGILGSMWARRSGLDKETQQAMLAAGRLGKTDEFSGRTIGMRTSMDTISVPLRTEKLASKYLSGGTRELTIDEFKERFGSRLSPTDIGTKWAQYKKFRKQYQDLQTANDTEKLSKLHFDRNLFTFLEGTELSEKALLEKNAGNKDKSREYTKAANFIENIYDPEGNKKFIDQQKFLLRNYSKAIESLRSGNDPNKDAKIKRIRDDIKGIRSNLRTSSLEKLAGNIGQWEGMYYSARDLFVNGNLLPNIINGRFFDDKYNSLNFLQPSKDDSLERSGIKIDFHAPKAAHNKFQKVYFDNMNTLYYLSPVTWARTLMTGEGFAYAGYLGQKKFEQRITKEIASFDWGAFMGDLKEGKDTYLTGIQNNLSQEQREMIQKFLKKDARLAKLAHQFGAVSRIKASIQKKFDVLIGQKVRDAVGKALLTKITNEVAVGLIKDWMLKGGIQTLVQGLTTAVSAALGVVGTPIAGAIAFLVSELVYRVSKPVIKFGAQVVVLLLIGIFASIFMLISSLGVLTLGQHSHVAPYEVVQCDAFVGTFPIIDDPDNPGGLNPQGPMEPFVAGALDSGEQCLLGSGSFSCTQGPYGSFSHSKVAAMDIGGTNYFHAPSFCGNGGSCKITYVGDVNCAAGYAGGLVKFTAEYKGQTYEFKLIHVDSPLAAGQTLTSGQRVARTMEWHETGSKCSSGKHLHLETKLNGATVNPHDVLTKSPSQGGFGCGISTCP